MFHNNRSIYLVLILCLVVIFLLEHKKFNTTLTELEKTDTSTAVTQNMGSANSNSGAIPATSGSNDTSTPKEIANLEKISTWLKTEAANLEKSNSNPTKKETQLKDFAETLSENEILFLKKTAVDSKSTANERILSTYVLTLGLQTTDAIADIAQENLSLSSPQPVHSLDETLLMQEKAIRIMAIDEFFKRVSLNPNLKNAFFQMANKIQDPGLRQYAFRRLEELK